MLKSVLPFVLAVTSTAVFADGLQVHGSVPHTILLSNHQTKTIQLMRIALSPSIADQLAQRISAIMQHPNSASLTKDLPPADYLGMNGEPVLDQGYWGTCATFATTGAINAIYPLADENMVSQLCNLQLGRTLENAPDGGWNGSFGYIVLGQITQYGFIDKTYQHASGCGGLKQYPAYSFNNGSAMPLKDFQDHSNPLFTAKDWTPIVSYDGHFSPISPADAEVALANVKQALNQGYRVVFGSLIDGNVGEVGAAGSYNNINNDTWVMTQQIRDDFKHNMMMEGHEIIIDGYDDNACATYTGTDPDKKPVSKQQCGLLRIRNSWSPLAGDQGDYYMSYDHFKGMVVEAYVLGADVQDNFKPVQPSKK